MVAEPEQITQHLANAKAGAPAAERNAEVDRRAQFLARAALSAYPDCGVQLDRLAAIFRRLIDFGVIK